MKTKSLLPFLGLLFCFELQANNIQVSNTTLVENTGTTAKVQFDISWENSWRGGGVNNWDAAWVFVKYRQGAGAWQHVYVNSSGHTAPAGSMLENGLVAPASPYNATTNPVVGVFIRRDADGNGTFTANGVQLSWDYGVLGIAYNDISEVQVFAIEMVYVNQGAFRLGSGGTEFNHFKIAGTNNPFQVLSEGSISLNQSLGLWADGGIEAAVLNASFPKGFAAHYAMKYEITVQQYVDFLNTLSREQQDARTKSDLSVGTTTVGFRFVMTPYNLLPTSNRTAVACDVTISPVAPIQFYSDANGDGVGGGSDDGQWVPCGNLNWGDVAAYLDWSGLRPMTELEFEKMCRGPLTPVPNEGAWGTAEVATIDYTISANGTAEESVSTGYSTTAGNCVWSATDGSDGGYIQGLQHVRVGLFAGHPSNTGRVSAGASYYGIMELSGNVHEYVVGVIEAEGRAYQGVHGNGSLTINGELNALSWPQDLGLILKYHPMVSTRSGSGGAIYDLRDPHRGGRGVRTAP